MAKYSKTLPEKNEPKEEVKEPKEQKFDAQAAFEQAVEDRTQIALVKRGDDKAFSYLSEWDYNGRIYQVYSLMNAGEYVKVGFMPVKDAQLPDLQ